MPITNASVVRIFKGLETGDGAAFFEHVADDAVGIRGLQLGKPTVIGPGIAAPFAHGGPVLVDAAINREELSIPPRIALAMAERSTPYMVKAVTNGRANEVLDMAATNLWR